MRWFRFKAGGGQADGSILSVQRTRQLVRRDGAYRTKKAARVLADEFLRPFNDGTFTIDSTTSIVQFVEKSYLPHVETRKRPITHRGYKNMWSRYLKPRVDAPLRNFRTVDGEQLLEQIARDDNLTVTTLAHVKSFLSGVFRYARRQGILNSENPMRDVVLPKARPSGETYAYSLEEIMQMLNVLPEPASTIVAVAGFAGVREGELRGLLWENYDGKRLSITRSVWRSHVLNPKTKASMAPVPVILQVREKVNNHRALTGNPRSGPIFPNSVGKPASLARIAHDVIRPTLERVNLAWHGWHAFRRGLATNLHRLGVADKVIQAILRHSNVATWMSAKVASKIDANTYGKQSPRHVPGGWLYNHERQLVDADNIRECNWRIRSECRRHGFPTRATVPGERNADDDCEQGPEALVLLSVSDCNWTCRRGQ